MITALFLTVALVLFLILSLASYETAIVLTLFLVPTFLIRFASGNIPTNFLEVLVCALFLIGLCNQKIRADWADAWRKRDKPFFLLIGLFIAACAISTGVSAEIRNSLGVLKGWVLIPVFYGWIVYAATRSNSHIRYSSIKALCFSGAVMASIGFFQGVFGRTHGVYDVPNSLALFLAPVFVITFWTVFTARQFFSINTLIAVLVGAGLLATGSFLGITSALIAIVMGLFIYKPVNSSYLFKALSFFTLAALVSLLLSGRISYLIEPLTSPDAHNSVSVRLQLWSIGMDLIKDHPLLGVGLNQFEPSYQAKLHERFFLQGHQMTASKKPIPEFVFRDPHNWLISFWLNTGVAGLIVFCWLNFYVLRKNIATTDKLKQAVFLALICTLLFGLADTIYWKNDLAVYYYVFLFLLV